ncbi:MAG TPA: GerMN domain-containing protein [Terriglobales bacterium]|jgi:hypothetical protein
MIPRHLKIGVTLMLLVALGMGVYVWRMRGRAQLTEPSAQYAPVGPPVSGPTERVTLYVADDGPGAIRTQPANLPLPSGRQEHAEELLRALVAIYLNKDSPHALPPGAEIRSVYLADPGLAVIDTNSVFAEQHRSGILVEELTIASLVETLSANVQGISRVKILVDGHTRETLAGHADLSGFYDATAVHLLVAQLYSRKE